MSDMSDENDAVEEPDEQPAEQPEEQDYRLKRSTMLPVEGVIYCLTHTVVHEDTVNPYGEGPESWCTKDEHRSIYYRGHKGDIDERLDEEARGRREPAIAAMAADALTPSERGLVLRLTNALRETLSTLTETTATLHRILGKDAADQEEGGTVGPLLRLTDSIITKLGDGNGNGDGDGDGNGDGEPSAQ